MSENNILKEVENFLYTTTGGYIVGNKRSNFKDVYKTIKQHIDLLDKDMDVTEFDKNAFIKNMDICKGIILENPLSNDDMDFLKKGLYLVYNGNNNVLKNEQIVKDTKYLTRIIDQHYTIVEAIDHLKYLHKKLKTMSQWNPPSFEISKHYLESFDEE